MPNKHQVIDLHQREPHLSSGEIASRLGCGSGWVRATFHRNGLKLATSRPSHHAGKEREECAKLAEQMGALDVARAIRNRHWISHDQRA